MLTIEYNEHGMSMADAKVENVMRSFCRRWQEDGKKEQDIYVANEIFIDVMKLLIIEKVISHEDVQFRFNGEILKVDDLGNIEKYPKGFADYIQNVLFKIVKKRSVLFRAREQAGQIDKN